MQERQNAAALWAAHGSRHEPTGGGMTMWAASFHDLLLRSAVRGADDQLSRQRWAKLVGSAVLSVDVFPAPGYRQTLHTPGHGRGSAKE